MTDSTNIAGARPAYDFEPIRTRGAARRTARAGGNVDRKLVVLALVAHVDNAPRLLVGRLDAFLGKRKPAWADG